MSEDNEKTEGQRQAQPGLGSIQRSEESERQRIKGDLVYKVEAIREGHTTGGYCETEDLLKEEKKLHAIISAEIEKAEARRDANLAFELRRQLAGLAYRPRLVVVHD